jgi:membrane dipeptidase
VSTASAKTSGATRAEALHERAIVIDAVCPLMRQPDHWNEWIAGGTTMAIPTIASTEDSQSAFGKIALWLQWLREYRDKITFVSRAGDIARAKKERKLGVTFHFQDTLPLDRSVGLVEVYQRLGVRMIQLCYNQKNFVGDGCSERTDSGLSDFGVSVIREMERVGIVVDLSHTGYRTTMDALDIAERPLVFSHSNVRKLCESRRNIRDDQIKAVAAKGGMVGINGFPAFVKKGAPPTLADFVEHIDYVAQLVGIDHVGLALDYYGQGSAADYAAAITSGRWRTDEYPPPPHIYPVGIEDARGFPNITRELLGRGYKDDDVLKVLGGNWVRVFREIWGE